MVSITKQTKDRWWNMDQNESNAGAIWNGGRRGTGPLRRGGRRPGTTIPVRWLELAKAVAGAILADVPLYVAVWGIMDFGCGTGP
jgi:hypothetical protein